MVLQVSDFNLLKLACVSDDGNCSSTVSEGLQVPTSGQHNAGSLGTCTIYLQNTDNACSLPAKEILEFSVWSILWKYKRACTFAFQHFLDDVKPPWLSPLDDFFFNEQTKVQTHAQYEMPEVIFRGTRASLTWHFNLSQDISSQATQELEKLADPTKRRSNLYYKDN